MGEKSAIEGLPQLIRFGKDDRLSADNEMNETLPQEVVGSEELDEVVTPFEGVDVEIVDLSEGVEDGHESAIALLDDTHGEDGDERRASRRRMAEMTPCCSTCVKWVRWRSFGPKRKWGLRNGPSRRPRNCNGCS
jgi:hypothetical protein